MVAWEQVNLKNAKARWDIHVKVFDFNLKPSEQVIANTTIHGDQFDVKLKGGPMVQFWSGTVSVKTDQENLLWVDFEMKRDYFKVMNFR